MNRTTMAPMRVGVIARRLDLPTNVREYARDVAARTASRGDEHAAGTTIAAASVYHSALLANEKRTQGAIAEVADVSVGAIGRTARRIREQDMDLRETLEVYRCTECGKVSASEGWLSVHAARHYGWGPFGLLPPLGNTVVLSEYIEVLEVEIVDVGTEVDGDV